MLVSTLVSLALSTLPETLAQGPAPPLSLCEEYFPGTSDACCDSIISRGASAPCAAPELVSNVTDCTMDRSPTGWACCVELDPIDPDAPGWGCIPNESLGEPLDTVHVFVRLGEGASSLYKANWAQNQRRMNENGQV
ncbi:hypothetical protein EJ07DRAFT_158816 [Lizonia empirigonia]|nr:hypothetical protein EJ07DRAFT_158816 [Lizonia empirigonia]